MHRTTATVSKAMAFLILFVFLLWGGIVPAEAARLKDLASIKGVRPNQLTGYGLVVGLDGTGDGNNAGFTTEGLINMMENLGIHITTENLRVKNVAGVMVTAQLPPFAKIGQSIDITVSSLGDSTSLEGGTLVATQLKGLDGRVYAVAQGAISIGGRQQQGAGAGQQNHPTVARVPNGATVEHEVPVSFADKKTLTLSLDAPDFTTVSRMVTVINTYLDGPYAAARDGATVDIAVPEEYQPNTVGLLADLENLEVEPDTAARVVLDERTGTVVMGKEIRIGRLAVSHGNLSLQIAPEPADPVEGRQGDRVVTFKGTATLGEVVRALNAIGASPRELIAIFHSIKAAGALQADLEII